MGSAGPRRARQLLFSWSVPLAISTARQFLVVTTLLMVCSTQLGTCLSFRSSIVASLASASSISSPSVERHVVPALASTPCDFDSYEGTGCEDEEGSYCDLESQKCSCKEGYPVRLLAYCLEKKEIGQECYTSAQCNQIENGACFIFGKEYDNERISGGHNVGRQLSNWPMGTCRCNMGHIFDNATNSCIKKATGGWCNEDWDCIKQTFNSQCARPQFTCECTWGYMYDAKTDTCVVPKLFGSKCSSDLDCAAESLVCSSPGRCVCPKGFHYDVLHPGCKANDDSSCQYGYRWDEEWGRCIPARSSSAAASQFNLNQRNKHIEPTTTVLEDDDSSPLQTLLILVLPNLVGLALIVRYCYFRKRDDGTEDLEDLERGMIRPTLSAYEKLHRVQMQRSAAVATAATVGGVAIAASGSTAGADYQSAPDTEAALTTSLAAINNHQGPMDDEDSVPLNPSIDSTSPALARPPSSLEHNGGQKNEEESVVVVPSSCHENSSEPTSSGSSSQQHKRKTTSHAELQPNNVPTESNLDNDPKKKRTAPDAINVLATVSSCPDTTASTATAGTSRQADERPLNELSENEGKQLDDAQEDHGQDK